MFLFYSQTSPDQRWTSNAVQVLAQMITEQTCTVTVKVCMNAPLKMSIVNLDLNLSSAHKVGLYPEVFCKTIFIC